MRRFGFRVGLAVLVAATLAASEMTLAGAGTHGGVGFRDFNPRPFPSPPSLTNPRPNTDSYVQGYAPAVEFKDMAKVFATGQNVCTPAKCYGNVLEIEEWNAFAPAEGHQLKYHAPGVGVVKIGSLDSSDQELLNLTSFTHLGASAMSSVRTQVRQLDQRGYQNSADYGTTSPAQ